MADSKHTPGPWETGQAHWNEDGDVMYTLHGIKEAKVADCRLVAAAPDLLEVLKEAALALDGLAKGEGVFKPIEQTIKLASAAIAKAEGRS